MKFKRKNFHRAAILIALGFIIVLLMFIGLRFSELKTSQSYFDNLDEALMHPEQVKVLIIRNQVIDSLPQQIGEFVNMKVLNLANNHLKTLPVSIGRLYNLE